VRRRLRALLVPLARLRATRRLPTPRRSRRQIAAHYDLGNDLFASFLDETMSYSSAIFAAPGASLREAQIHKLDRVCRKLGLSERDHVLEVGCGWGGFAIHAAGNYGCRVTAATISREQHALATERVRAAALEDRVEVILRDYRDLDGRYDKLVSIEMIEAVGWQYFDRYFARCSELLRDDGAMLLQAITIDDRAYEVEKHGRSFMNTLIFPGGCLPSLGAIGASLGRVTDLTSVHLEDISAHYVTTLRHWRERFAAAADRDELDPGRYDARFRRLWELYLAYCEAGFAERRIRDVQLVLAKPAFRSEPLLGVEPAGEQRPALSAAG
jgi:cyclopropane-fatty-acyl-phospholipid synthase